MCPTKRMSPTRPCVNVNATRQLLRPGTRVTFVSRPSDANATLVRVAVKLLAHQIARKLMENTHRQCASLPPRGASTVDAGSAFAHPHFASPTGLEPVFAEPKSAVLPKLDDRRKTNKDTRARKPRVMLTTPTIAGSHQLVNTTPATPHCDARQLVAPRPAPRDKERQETRWNPHT